MFWGAAVPKGGLFALLQSAGMTATAPGPIMGAIGGAIGGTVGSAYEWLAGTNDLHQDKKDQIKEEL